MTLQNADLSHTSPPESLRQGGLVRGNVMAATYFEASKDELTLDATENLWAMILVRNFPWTGLGGYIVLERQYSVGFNDTQFEKVLLKTSKSGFFVPQMILCHYKETGRDGHEARETLEDLLAEYCLYYLEEEYAPSWCYAMAAIGTHVKLFKFKDQIGDLEALWDSPEGDDGFKDAVDDGDFLRGYLREIRDAVIEA